MLMTTTNKFEGSEIQQYLGIITGEAILGANIFKDFFAGIRDIVGGRSASYEKELQEARRIAFSELEEKAAHLGAMPLSELILITKLLGIPAAC